MVDMLVGTWIKVNTIIKIKQTIINNNNFINVKLLCDSILS